MIWQARARQSAVTPQLPREVIQCIFSVQLPKEPDDEDYDAPVLCLRDRVRRWPQAWELESLVAAL